MEKERKKRYHEKIEYARERIADLEDWLYEDAREKKTFFACEKAFQELVEALADLFAMILSDLKLGLKDDYSNIEKLKDKNILTKEDADIVIEANGLRNRIVHKYNSVDEVKFIESSRELLPKLAEIINNIESFITKSLNKND